MPETTDIGILAAGSSSRMRGRDKLLEQVDGIPLLRRTAEAALGVEDARVHVALPPDADDRRQALEGLSLTLVEVPDAAKGMGHSIARLAQIGHGPLLLCFADMPEIGAADITRLLDAFTAAGKDTVVRAVDSAARPGHPILFPARFRPALGQLTGDAGPRDLIREELVIGVQMPGATTDLDTPEDWAAWRAKR